MSIIFIFAERSDNCSEICLQVFNESIGLREK